MHPQFRSAIGGGGLSVLIGMTVVLGGPVAVPAEARPNVLFIMADDLRPEVAGYGSVAVTPNLDRLAARGVQFDRAYCQQAVCNPSRSSLLTGRRPDTLRVWSNSVHFREPNPDVPTIPLWFKDHGYQTRCAGKIFHNWHTAVHGDPRSWSAPEFLHFANHGYDEPQVDGPVPPDLAAHSPRTYGRVPLVECRDVPDEAYYDGRVAAEAVRVLGELAAADRPFFLAVGFWKPHAPFTAPKRYWDLYDRDRLPPLDPRRPADTPEIAFHDSREVLGPPDRQRPLSAEASAEMRHGYFAAVSYMDAQLGKVLDALDRSGRADDTVIVFVADHGYHLGEHALWAKTSNFELDARVPLLVADPRGGRRGVRSDAIVELVDLFPTLTEACGLPPAGGTEGKSLLPVVRGTADAVKQAAFTQHPRPAYFDREPGARPQAMGVSVRTDHVRYTEWRDWTTGETIARELYAHPADAAELRNAVDDPAFTGARDEAERLLRAQFPPTPHPAPAAAPAAASRRSPNIVLVITDDQGYGDLGHTGNAIVKTPHLDALAAESSRLTDFHVAPTCSPTRAALLTGHWTDRTGVWHTVNGRSMLREDEITLGRLLRDHGYATGMFGKWHLGDNVPYRPEDRGFTEVYRHGGGGVGQTPDFWDNAYFDGRYVHNGEVVPAEGFCTDVFFSAARRFIREQAAAARPFLAYIAPNAPHAPLHAPPKDLARYADQQPDLAAFYAMITNIDDNVGATRALLRDLGIDRDTLFIFMTDNGTATGEKIFNAGMRGKKGSEYEGGHRVPFIAHWPAAGWNRPHASAVLAHAVDVVPTLLDVTGAVPPPGLRFDGRSLMPLLDPAGDVSAWPHDRVLVTDSQRVRDPVKWKQTAVMSGSWRLVNGRELYDIAADPGQERDVAAAHPDRVATLTAFYDAWWAELEPTFARTTEIYLGHLDHPVVSLTGHDWIQDELPPWHQGQIRAAQGMARPGRRGGKRLAGGREALDGTAAGHAGHWAVKVVRSGRYEIAVRRWPVEADAPITAALPAGANVPGASRAFRTQPGIVVHAVSATLRIDGRDVATLPVAPGDRSVVFTADLAAGSHALAPVFTTADSAEVGCFYAVVRSLD
jgi:arylsulfatase A-like enzyme